MSCCVCEPWVSHLCEQSTRPPSLQQVLFAAAMRPPQLRHVGKHARKERRRNLPGHSLQLPHGEPPDLSKLPSLLRAKISSCSKRRPMVTRGQPMPLPPWIDVTYPLVAFGQNFRQRRHHHHHHHHCPCMQLQLCFVKQISESIHSQQDCRPNNAPRHYTHIRKCPDFSCVGVTVHNRHELM